MSDTYTIGSGTPPRLVKEQAPAIQKNEWNCRICVLWQIQNILLGGRR